MNLQEIMLNKNHQFQKVTYCLYSIFEVTKITEMKNRLVVARLVVGVEEMSLFIKRKRSNSQELFCMWIIVVDTLFMA